MSGVSSVGIGAVPYYGQFSSAESTPAAATAQPQDIVDIQSNLGGTFTSDASDAYSLSSLYSAAAATGNVVGYKVALGDNSGDNGQLWLNNQDVTGQTSFTADQFSQLQYIAGASETSESIVVVAQSGTLAADGTISSEVDSSAVQVTDSVTGTRSINAATALLAPLTGTDASALAVAQSSAIFTGINGAVRPSLNTVGNITTAAQDAYSVSDLFNAAPASGGGGIVGYRVALGDNSGNNGQLLLNGHDVTGQTLFTADQFANLQYIAGSKGSSETLEVVARSGTVSSDGSIANEVDSPAVQINASATGTRSINAANALLTPDTGTDASEIGIAQSANIFTGIGGAARPTLSTVGNITAAEKDAFSVSSLFTAAPPRSGPDIVGYKVALGDNLGDNGTLLLDGKDVTGQTSFTADQFSNLQYIAGSLGSNESLEVVAQSGTLNADGSVGDEIDSPAVQITASVTGTRSINGAIALLTQPKGTDAASVAIAQQADIFTGFNGAARPSLTTVGNFTAAATDVYSVSDLFDASPAAGGSDIVSYKVALGDSSGGNGKLLLDGKDVTGQVSFTADEFANLHYVAGAANSNESLEVIAQTGTVLADGSLSNEIDSPAVQINASVTGTRSINAANALLTPLTGPDAASISIAQSANIFAGFGGAARPGLTTVGNFTADTGDKYSLGDLFNATPASDIVGYRVALGDSSGNNGHLLLNGKDVTGQSTFSADEFANLQYVAGASSSSQSIEVVAQSGTALADGSVSNEVDSPAVQITASVTGTRSLNAANALSGQLAGSDAAAIEIAQQAAIFTGFNGTARPGLTSLADLAVAATSQDAASLVLGAFQSTVAITTVSANLSGGRAGDGGSLQTAVTTQERATAQAARLLALGQDELGGSQSSGATPILQLYAYAAYQTSGVAPGSTTSTSA